MKNKIKARFFDVFVKSFKNKAPIPTNKIQALIPNIIPQVNARYECTSLFDNVMKHNDINKNITY